MQSITERYEALRSQFIREITIRIEAQKNSRTTDADASAVTNLTNYFELNSTKPISQIYAQVHAIASNTTTTVTTSTGVFSSKTEAAPTAFATNLFAVLNRFNPGYLLSEVDSSFNQALMMERQIKDQIAVQSRTDIGKLQRQVEDLSEQKEIADEQLSSLKVKYKKLEEEFEEVEKALRETEDNASENLKKLTEAKQLIEEYREKIKEQKAEMKKLKAENSQLKMEAVKLEAQVTTLNMLKDQLSGDLKARLAEMEKLKKETEARLEKSEATIAEQRALITRNQQFITDQLDSTIANVNQSILDQSFNTSRVLREAPFGKQNRAPSTAAKAAASQAKVFQAPAPVSTAVPVQPQGFDNDCLKKQFKYITDKSKDYLSVSRVHAIFAVAKFVMESVNQSPERAFGLEAIKLLAPLSPTTYLSTGECINELDQMVAARQLKGDKIAALLKTLHGLPTDGKQRQLDGENQSKLLHALHLIFAEGYPIPELTSFYPVYKRPVSDVTQDEFATSILIK